MLTTALLVIGLYGAYVSGALHLRTAPPTETGRDRVPRRARATWASVLVVVVGILLQSIFPGMLPALERNAPLIASGQLWRLVTALLVQRGGLAASVFNVVSLALIGSVAERLWGTGRWVVIFAAGGILSEIVALTWQPIGAGNSVANFSLAGAICVFCLMRRPPRPVVATACMALGGCGVLLFRRDIHGAAAFIGATMGLALL